jgi:hypothetical protein
LLLLLSFSVRNQVEIEIEFDGLKNDPMISPLRTPSVRVASDSSSSSSSALIRVCLRVRPLFEHEASAGSEVAVRALPDAKNVHVLLRGSGEGSARQFTFDGVLGPDSSQEDVFQLAGVRNLIDSGLRGENVSILAYGQTGSGKTYTMSGVSEREIKGSIQGDTIGIIPRAVRYLFSRIASDAFATTNVEASFCEIYNENLYDLLNLSGEALQLRHSPRRGFHVKGQLVVKCDDAQDVFEVLEEGHRTRSVASHALNADSSRSHSILTLVINRTAHKRKNYTSGEEADAENEPSVGQSSTTSKIIFVDLAGSERIKDSKSEGVTAMEGRQINKSLFTLGKVIACLGSAQQRRLGGERGRRPDMETSYIPYRDSTLTKLLADSLGGSARTLLLSCVSPASEFTDETISTLQFSLRASRIENAPIVQVIGSEKSDIAQQHALMILKRENRALKRENEALRMRLGLPLTGSIDQFLAESALSSPAGQHLSKGSVPPNEVSKTSSEGDGVIIGDQGKQTDIINSGGGGGTLRPALRLPYKPQGTQQNSSNNSTGRRSRASSGKVGRTNLSSGGGRSNNNIANPYAQLFPSSDGNVSDGSGGPLSTRAPQFASRIDARLAERGGTKLVLDAQQAELDQLHKERGHLLEKGKAAKARIAALQFSLVVYKGTIERMASELESARRQHDRLLHYSHPNESNLSVFSSSVLGDGEGPSTAVSEHSDMSSLEKMQLNAVEVDLQNNSQVYQSNSDFESEDGDKQIVEPPNINRGFIRGSSQSRIPILIGR